MILLICGSRKATPAMLDYARRCVIRAKENDWQVICGDADGVDFAVMNACHQHGVPCTIYGANGKLRRRTPSCQVIICSGSYYDRDERMAKECDQCMAIWNGVILPNGKPGGTRKTYEYALDNGKVAGDTAWLINFGATS